MEKPIGIHVREAVKGWTYSMMVMCDDGDGDGEYPDSLWTGGAYATYFEAWDAAQAHAALVETVVLGEKKTQAQLDDAKAAEEERHKLFEARLARIRKEKV